MTTEKVEKTRRTSLDGYRKKKRYPFALHEDVRYDKLQELVAHYQAKSASDYLEQLIIKEWEKLQRKRRNE